MQVPTYTGRVQQAALPGAPQQQRGSIASEGVFQSPAPPAPRPDPTPGLVAEALGQFDAFLTKQRDEQDAIRAEEQVNKLREYQLAATYDPDKGFTAVRGRHAVEPDKNGLGLVERYAADFDSTVGRLSGELANDAQRRKFQQKAALIGLDFRGELTRHSSTEFRNHAVSTLQAGIKLESDLAATRLGAPDVVLPDGSTVNPLRIARDRVEAMVLKLRDQQGLSADAFELVRRGALTDLHKGVLDAALAKGNVAFAESYLQQNKNDFTGDGLLDMRRKLDARTQVVDVVAEVGKLMAGNREYPPLSREAVLAAAIHQESNGRQFDKNGNPLTSSAGAVGRMQIMPETGPQAAKLAGLPWSLERLKKDPDYNEALGRAYFDEQIRAFGGDMAKALAAYNAGPRWVAEAVERAKKATPGTQQADWFWQLANDKRKPENRKQTYDYVTNILDRASKGVPKRDLATLEKTLDAKYSGNPEALKAARLELRHQFKVQEDAVKEREENALGAVLRALDAGKSYSEVRTMPEHAQLNPKDLDNVQRFADTKAKRLEPETDWSLYTTLMTQPKELLGANLPSLRGRLGEAEYKELVKRQAGLKKDPDSGTRVETQNAVVNRLLASNGIVPSPPETNEEGWKKVGQFKVALQREVTNWEADKGRTIPAEEFEKLASKLLVEVTLPRTFLGVPQAFGRDVKMFELANEPNAGKAKIKIPDADRAMLVGKFIAQGVKKPSDAQIEQAFRKMKGL